MLKHFIVFLILSALLILTLPYCHQALQLLLQFHQFLIGVLSRIFANGSLAVFLKRLIVLLIIPIILGAIIATLYWAVRRTQAPYMVHFVWIVWIVLATALVMQAAG